VACSNERPGGAEPGPLHIRQSDARSLTARPKISAPRLPSVLNASVNLGDVGHAIQLALAPVFLLTGIAGILNVMAGRLARIIDRGRQLTEHPLPQGLSHSETVQVELLSLERRRHLASAAITACTFSALLVCTVIVALFIEVLLQVELKWLAGALFTGSTVALVVGLAYFLREVHLATHTVRIPAAAHSHPPQAQPGASPGKR